MTRQLHLTGHHEASWRLPGSTPTANEPVRAHRGAGPPRADRQAGRRPGAPDPLLRARGLFRAEYTGTTLREHYGLPRPVNGFRGAPARRPSEEFAVSE